MNIKNLSLTADTASAIANRVMKDRAMRITDKFVPAVSDYTVNINSLERVKINLMDDSFSCITEHKRGDKWFIVNAFGCQGTLESVENMFFKTLEKLNKLQNIK